MQPEDTADDQALRDQLYARTRDELLKRQLSNNENYDRAILTLASAALATSVAFLRGMNDVQNAEALMWSWVALVIAIISTLVSYCTSQKGINRQLEIAERYYLDRDSSALKEGNFWGPATECLAVVSAFAFVIGIILLLFFFNFNLQTN